MKSNSVPDFHDLLPEMAELVQKLGEAAYRVTLLENKKKTIVSELRIAAGNVASALKDDYAYSHDAYRNFSHEHAEAIREERVLKARQDYLDWAFKARQSLNADQREAGKFL